jgi:hypothetical protein
LYETSLSGYRNNSQVSRDNAWRKYLAGENPGYPERALKMDFARIRSRIQAMRQDPTTPDTRLSDDPMKFNPASVTSLIQLMLGGIHPGHKGSVLFCRLRYFDPAGRRAGIPEGVAALVESMTDESVAVKLVNTDQLKEKTVIVQAGGYAEHQFNSVKLDGQTLAVDAPTLTVRLMPGCGSRLEIEMKRHVNQPTMLLPRQPSSHKLGIRISGLETAATFTPKGGLGMSNRFHCSVSKSYLRSSTNGTRRASKRPLSKPVPTMLPGTWCRQRTRATA